MKVAGRLGGQEFRLNSRSLVVEPQALKSVGMSEPMAPVPQVDTELGSWQCGQCLSSESIHRFETPRRTLLRRYGQVVSWVPVAEEPGLRAEMILVHSHGVVPSGDGVTEITAFSFGGC